MTQEDKDLLLKDLCARLPYGVKIMVEGWDSDMDCEFTTIEMLIGIDDRFIHTIWDKTGDKDKHSIIEPLSILDYKPYLRPMSSMTEDECITLSKLIPYETDAWKYIKTPIPLYIANIEQFDFFNSHHLDWRGLISKGLAIEVTKDNNPYKE